MAHFNTRVYFFSKLCSVLFNFETIIEAISSELRKTQESIIK